jgi:hypothetical protein
MTGMASRPKDETSLRRQFADRTLLHDRNDRRIFFENTAVVAGRSGIFPEDRGASNKNKKRTCV